MQFEKGQPRLPNSGRRKGTPNRATAARQQAVADSGMTPLDYLLSVMRDTSQDVTVRLNAARSAAPYVHPKLATVEVRAEVTSAENTGVSRVQEMVDRLLQGRPGA